MGHMLVKENFTAMRTHQIILMAMIQKTVTIAQIQNLTK